MDFSGHGRKALPDAAFSMALFAEDVLELMREKGLEQVSIFGYSMGGYVGMYLAKHHPEKVDKVITLATKFHWDAETAEKEIRMLNAAKIEEKLPAFAATLAQRHEGKDWKEVLSRTAAMLQALGADNTLKTEDYREIEKDCLLLLGDRDKMVGLDETLAVYQQLPKAKLGILPGTPHPIEQVDTELLSFFTRKFIG
jgi:pimeloyl-ACP methyl ester carboxylesterase